MAEKYKVADLLFEMDTFGRTLQQAEPYICNCLENTDFVLTTYSDEVKNLYEGIDDDLAEYLGTGVSFYKELLKHNGMMLHSSAVVVDGQVYLFSADSGTGKSTHTMLWRKLFPSNSYILNDDKPALRYVDGIWYAYGTPWSGKHDISVNIGVPVKGIAFVERGSDNIIEPYGGKLAILDFLKQVNRPRGMEYRILVLDLLDKLLRDVPVWKLKCNMDPEAAIVSYEAMSGKKYKEND